MDITIRRIATVFTLLAFTIAISSFKSDKGKAIADFSLRNVNGKVVSTTDYKSAKGFIIIFTCNHCPFAKLYTKRMNDLNSKYTKLNVPLIAINSMDTLVYEEESFAKMKLKAKEDSYSFPYLQDALQTVGKDFGAEHTPAAYVVWKENNQWHIKYKGAIDNNGQKPELATSFIGNAVDELLQGKAVSNPKTESFGCKIFYR